MTCYNCNKYESCVKADGTTRYLGKFIAVGNVEEECSNFSKLGNGNGYRRLCVPDYIEVKEYNERWYPRYQQASTFVHAIDHCINKAKMETDPVNIENHFTSSGWNAETCRYLYTALDYFNTHCIGNKLIDTNEKKRYKVKPKRMSL